jgi:hypothetical protein
MVRSAGGKRVTRDMTKAQVKSHVTTQTGRHASPATVPLAPKVGAAPRPRKAAKVRAKM